MGDQSILLAFQQINQNESENMLRSMCSGDIGSPEWRCSTCPPRRRPACRTAYSHPHDLQVVAVLIGQCVPCHVGNWRVWRCRTARCPHIWCARSPTPVRPHLSAFHAACHGCTSASRNWRRRNRRRGICAAITASGPLGSRCRRRTRRSRCSKNLIRAPSTTVTAPAVAASTRPPSLRSRPSACPGCVPADRRVSTGHDDAHRSARRRTVQTRGLQPVEQPVPGPAIRYPGPGSAPTTTPGNRPRTSPEMSARASWTCCSPPSSMVATMKMAAGVSGLSWSCGRRADTSQPYWLPVQPAAPKKWSKMCSCPQPRRVSASSSMPPVPVRVRNRRGAADRRRVQPELSGS